MATIQSPGIGSGLDVNSIVESLVAAERAPATARMDSKEAQLQVKISALGAMKSALSDFRGTFSDLKTTSTFNSRTATLSNEETMEAEAGTAATPGIYEIKVTQLAQGQKMVSGGFESEAAAVGSGELTVTVGDKDYLVEIPEDTKSLADIRDAINSTLQGEGVTASLLNVDDGEGGTHTRMTITSGQTGSDGEITITANADPITDGEPGLQSLVDGMEELVAAQDAIVEIDGLSVTSSSNTLSNVIGGVTLTLNAADLEESTTLTIAEDNSSFTAEINKFIEGYNALQDALSAADSYDSDSQTSGALFGDSVLRGFRLSMSTTIGYIDRDSLSPYSSLAAMGVTTNESGQLELDESKLNAALENGFDDVVDFFTHEETGFAQRLDDFVYGYSKFDGIVQGRLDGLDARVDDITDQRYALEERVASVEARYRSQFQALDQMMSQLSTTSSYLAAQLSSTSSDS
ncbi:MAG: flagellar filament capping protein FliD [Granulosicoccaceae bacterium]